MPTQMLNSVFNESKVQATIIDYTVQAEDVEVFMIVIGGVMKIPQIFIEVVNIPHLIHLTYYDQKILISEVPKLTILLTILHL
jgi:hypothetical protein